MAWYEKILGDLGDKKRYREYRQRVKNLPPAYRDTTLALERYLLHLGPSDQGRSLVTMLDDLADLMEQNSAAGTPVRDVVGADPVEFAELFMANYEGGSWIRSERARLVKAVDEAERASGHS